MKNGNYSIVDKEEWYAAMFIIEDGDRDDIVDGISTDRILVAEYTMV